MKSSNRYEQIIERIFLSKYQEGISELDFVRQDIIDVAQELGMEAPKNVGDVIYSFRYRNILPNSIKSKAPEGYSWIIRSVGRSRYRFIIVPEQIIIPSQMLSETKIPDATPGMVLMYSLSDEQALLARLRYNRLIDIFTGVTCYSLQNHLRTTVPNIGQVETDELYIGVDRRGAHYVFPVQAKGKKDRLSIVQIEQDFALCAAKFPSLICRPIAAQFMDASLIALFEFEQNNDRISIVTEKHYRLVAPESISKSELESYQHRSM
ncbi:hypothetical protein NIES4071_78600 [Calothrix sp. NIES-4071]|nr:hypothetical protein NIES4071_78600 [Calothrix sp. NIES-4071]BAZ62132.1 hypothetical protein NIES4105_78530 [Calothrix sp. NIES-4105]